MNGADKRIDFENYYDHKRLENEISEIRRKYDFLEISNLGYSILGKSIPKISFGNGKKSVVFIAAHHGMEWITSALIMRFLEDFCYEYKRASSIFDISTRVIFETRKIHIIPMLNPDGVGYAIHGVKDDNILKDRLLRMNGGNNFSHWQANARGVDLNHNYYSGFEEYKIIEKANGIFGGAPTKYSGEYSESEPETRALCNFIRFEMPELAISLHTQGEEIYYTSGDRSAKNSLAIAKTIARLTGYQISLPSGTAKYGGFTDWFIDEFNKPSLTLECGHGSNPLPFSDFKKIYYRIKRALFTAPILI